MIHQIIEISLKKNASDIILASGNLPAIKQYGKIVYLEELQVLQSFELKESIFAFMSEEQQKVLLSSGEIDFSFEISDLGRFRINVFSQSHGISVIMRIVSSSIPKIFELGVPNNLLSLIEKKSGLILITGGVGSGKSSTLAALLDEINTKQKRHIITLEDPIEFTHSSKNSLIEQREVGKNTKSYENGLMYALRQASDVIMIGEMRDLESFRLALRAAETGNLVLATLHTSGAARTIARIIDMFSGDEKNHIRAQLAESLLGVLWQDLIPASKEGRVLAAELLVKNTGVENMIRESRVHQINGAIETGKADGMIPMKHTLKHLLESGKISKETYEKYMKVYGIM